jgi:arginyl-tRNA synthetase
MKLEQKLIQLIQASITKTFPQLDILEFAPIELDLPKERNHGDFSTNIAMRLSSQLRKPPLDIANSLVDSLKSLLTKDTFVSEIRAEKPGFINFFLSGETYLDILCQVLKDCKALVSQDLGKADKVQIEFVSANPTGPLSVAHGRQAAVGESLSRIFNFFNYKVTKEYYLNDEGNQMNLLGVSILARYQELQGKPGNFPEDGYQGDYVKDIASQIIENKAFLKADDALKLREAATEYGLQYLLKVIKKDLEDFGVTFDIWYSQRDLRTSGKIEKALQFLKDKGYTYEQEGALWFKSTEFGDDKDRVLIKSDGSFTYLAPDVAYHQDKFKRGFKRVINIWGPDHHGYIPRIKAAVQALSVDSERLSIIIVQLARIFKAGVPLVMSTRRAQYITLREVMDEVGADAAKFFFLTRRTDSHLDFDLEIAKRQSSENPVYYVQYAYARIAGIFKLAKEKKIKFNASSKADFSLLTEAQEKELLRLLIRFPFSVSTALRVLDPYPICQYLMELATEFHRFYDRHKVLLEDNPDLANARMQLAEAVGIVISQGLELLAIKSPQRM